jgi:hypothetical protein
LLSIDIRDIESARTGIVNSAKKMLAGTLSYIEGSRNIFALVQRARLSEKDLFLPFVGRISETDRFPPSEVRLLWHADALERMQPELDHAEAWARTIGKPACHAVIDLIEKEQIS